MTAEQAIEFLKFYETTIPKEPPIEAIIDKDKYWYRDNQELLEAIDMAIKALEENERLKADRAGLVKDIERWNEVSYEHHEAIKKVREEIEKKSNSESGDIYNEYAGGRVDGLDTALEILDKYLGENKNV